jgi:oligosaccharide translocation protein RFT1
MIARILFQPLEETLRTILPRLLSAPTHESLQQSSLLIVSLLKLYILLGSTIHSIIAPLIPSLLMPILNLVLGRNRFPSTALASILYAYLYYIPIMAVNGVTESVVASVATTTDLAKQSRAMVFCSVAFLGTAWALLRMAQMGGEGLVWANCVNMGFRILWSCNFIRAWYSSKGVKVDWSLALPARGTMIATLVIGLVIRWVCGKAGLTNFIPTVGLAGLSGLTLVGCMYAPFFQN